MAMSYDCIIVGAGISGLGAAYGLLRRDAALLVVEAGPSPGGAMQSERTPEGFVLEHGPNTVVSNDPQLWQQFDDLQIGGERMVAGKQGSKRFILYRGKPQPIPMAPPALIGTPLLSPAAKLRVLAEPLLPRATTPDESARSFFARRLGREPAERFVDPFISGIYAGDPASLSISAAFPTLWEAEQRAGSILLGMLTAKKDPSKPRGHRDLFSFNAGLNTWPQAVARALGPERLWLSTRALSLRAVADGWQLTVVRKNGDRAETLVLHASELILAVPAYVAADLVAGLDPDAAQALRSYQYPPLAVVHLGYWREDVEHALDGFGMLCPGIEQRKILGSLWPSTLFPSKAPAGMVLTTQFVGGMRSPELALQDDAALIAGTHNELRELLGVRGEPSMARVVRWSRAIPQYMAGHGRRIAAIEQLEAARPGLHLLGNYRDGVAAAQCWKNGVTLAGRVRLPRTVEQITG